MADDDRTVGLVLAAGVGSRYGRPKVLVDGWLEGAVTALREGGCGTVAIVTGAARPVMPEGTSEVHCAAWERGIGASLRAGLTVGTGEDRVVVHLVDCPDVGPAVVRRVLERTGSRLGRAVYFGRPGHPVVIPRAHVGPLLATLADDDGAGPYLRTRAHVAVECGDLATGKDVDTPAAAADPMAGSDP